jgi:hypothetical protein
VRKSRPQTPRDGGQLTTHPAGAAARLPPQNAAVAESGRLSRRRQRAAGPFGRSRTAAERNGQPPAVDQPVRGRSVSILPIAIEDRLVVPDVFSHSDQAHKPGSQEVPARPTPAGLQPAGAGAVASIYSAGHRDVRHDPLHPAPGLWSGGRVPPAAASRGLASRLRNVSAAEVPQRSQARLPSMRCLPMASSPRPSGTGRPVLALSVLRCRSPAPASHCLRRLRPGAGFRRRSDFEDAEVAKAGAAMRAAGPLPGLTPYRRQGHRTSTLPRSPRTRSRPNSRRRRLQGSSRTCAAGLEFGSG